MATQSSYVPTHPDLFAVEFLPGKFASRLVSLKVRFCQQDFTVSRSVLLATVQVIRS